MLVVPRLPKLEPFCYLLTVVVAAAIAYRCSRDVNYQFIDEFFHVRQAQTYLEGQFDQWDNKITTPPGLYWLAYIYIKGLPLSGEITSLRSLNLVGGLVALPMVLSQFPNKTFWPVLIVVQPLLFCYYFLFYTDVWSTVFVVASLVAATRRKPWLSGAFGLVLLWFRQTNIIWVAFILLLWADHSRRERGLERIQPFIRNLLRPGAIPYYINFALFRLFLKINGGITFGDKENHQISVHGVQVLYCTMFICLFTWPTWLSKDVVCSYFRFIKTNVVVNLLAAAAIAATIKYTTIVHPFLLADNRHYTFYLWRRVIGPLGVAATPGYHFCGWVVLSQLRVSWISIITFVGALVLTLVPLPLFEPRYYIVPVVLFRMYTRGRRPLLEYAWLMAINLAVALVFFRYTFSWETEPFPQRIIW